MAKRPIKYIDRALIESPYIGLCQDAKSFKKEMKLLKIPKADRPAWVSEGKNGTLHTFTHPQHGITCVVCIKEEKKTTPTEICGLIVHEAVHAWQKLRQDIGENAPSEEFEAYSIQTIAQRLITAYKYKYPKKGRQIAKKER